MPKVRQDILFRPNALNPFDTLLNMAVRVMRTFDSRVDNPNFGFLASDHVERCVRKIHTISRINQLISNNYTETGDVAMRLLKELKRNITNHHFKR